MPNGDEGFVLEQLSRLLIQIGTANVGNIVALPL
jgi:hypothetical protein